MISKASQKEIKRLQEAQNSARILHDRRKITKREKNKIITELSNEIKIVKKDAVMHGKSKS